MSWKDVPWSVRSAVAKDVSEWRDSNTYQQKLRLPQLYHDLIFYSERPVRLCLTAALLVALIAFYWLQFAPTAVPTLWGELTKGERMSYFTSLWAVQTTIAALVYPIVISFVTIFLQRRPATQALLHLYIIDTGALVAGLSSLALVVLMAMQYVLLTSFSQTALFALSAIDSVWFLCNAALTAFFLFRTIEFLQPEVQRQAMQRYAANIALPRDVESAYATQLLVEAPLKGWLGIPSAYAEPQPKGPQARIGGWFSSKAPAACGLRIARRARLVDLRLWPLRAALSSWAKRANRIHTPREGSEWRRERWPVIDIPVDIDEVYEGTVDLARIENGPKLSWWERRLVMGSFVFRGNTRQRYRVRIADILNELQMDAQAAISAKDTPSFSRSYQELVQLHRLLIGAALCPSADGTKNSCALLQTADYSIFGEALHVAWARTYRPLTEAAIERINDDSSYLRRLCHVPQHLSGHALEASPLQVRDQILTILPSIMYDLGKWWIRSIEEGGQSDFGPHTMLSLDPPSRRTYQEVVSHFVGGWESARDAVARTPDATEEFSWQSARDTARLNATHVTESAHMLLSAVLRGDREAAEWFADVLSKWFGSISQDHEPFSLYGKTSFLTLSDLDLPWSQVARMLGIRDDDVRLEQTTESRLQHGAMIAALKNFMTDMQITVVEQLLHWAYRDTSASLHSSLAMHIISGLLSGRAWRGGGDQRGSLSEITASKYLRSKLRQRKSDGNFGGYKALLDSFVERIGELERPIMVSGRSYVSTPSELDSLLRSNIAVFTTLSGQAWVADERTLRQMSAWLTERRHNFESATRLINEWIEGAEVDDPVAERVCDQLLTRLDRPHTFNAGRQHATAALNAFRTSLQEMRADAVANADIDQERLTQIASYASEKAFASATGEFPLQLFRSINYTQDSLTPFTLALRKMRKGELTTTPLEDRAINEASYWAQTMANHVGVLTLSDALKRADLHDLVTPDAATYWIALKNESAKIRALGLQPVLILDNATRPDWVWNWQYPSESDRGSQRPNDLQVHRAAGRGDGYVCDFNDIHVYAAPIPPGQSILLCKETFDMVTFQEFAQGSFVSVSVVPDEDNHQLVDVLLTISRLVRTNETPAFRLRYETSVETREGA